VGRQTEDRSSGSRLKLYRSFVVVLWLESGQPGEDAEWRWRVRCVQSGDEKCFRRLQDMLAFVAGQAGTSPPQ